MKDIRELFSNGEVNADNVLQRLEEAGYVVLEASDGGYIPASRLEEERRGFEAEIARERATNALKYELMRCGAHNPALAASAVGLDGILGCEGDPLSAARRKVAELKEAEPYMFSSDASVSAGVSTGAPHGGIGTDPDKMSDSEYYRYKNVN